MPVCLDVPYARNDFSPAAGWGTKMTENSPHQATIPFRLYIVPLHLLSIFFYVGSAQITCGDLPPRLSSFFP